MGGNVFKHNHDVVRLGKDVYFKMYGDVRHKLERMSGLEKCELVKAYNNKSSFGDMDILCVGEYTKDDVSKAFGDVPVSKNGPVISILYKQFQIDLINVHQEDFEMSKVYYSYNDLGNFMGRVAHRMGFKYGHDGLWLILRDVDYVYAKICVSKSPRDIFEFLGYDYGYYLLGFVELEDVFEFASSTRFFNPDMFLDEYRNAKSLVRDRKRESYRLFKEYVVKNSQTVSRYPYENMSEKGGRVAKDEFLFTAYIYFGGFKEKVEKAKQEHQKRKELKNKFNGDIVRNLTGLDGKELGMFIANLKDNYCFDDMTDEQIKNTIIKHFLETIP